MTHTSRRIVVVGGGISGLAAAHRLVELNADADVTLIEASDRLGGVIHTIEQDGCMIEAGPENFVTNKPAGLDLCARLGSSDQIVETNDAFRRALIVRDGRLAPIPEGFLMMAPTRLMPVLLSPMFSLRGKLRMGLEPFIRRRRDDDDESLASFVTRRMGKEALDRIVQPLVGGIYTADPRELSLRATMPMFLEMEKRHGSIYRAMRSRAKGADRSASGARYSLFVTLRDGMRSMIDVLAERIGEQRIRCGQPVESIGREDDRWRVACAGDVSLEADAVIIAGPAHLAAKLLTNVDDELSAMLSQVRYASSAVAHLCYRREQVAHPLDAFGFVVPHVEKRSVLAGSFSSVKFPNRAPAGRVLLRAFMGGAMQEDLLRQDDDALLQTAIGEMRELLGVSGEPVWSMLHRWPESMPQYAVGHLDRVAAMHARLNNLPGLELAGNTYDGVGIPDCIRGGEQAAERIHGGSKPS